MPNKTQKKNALSSSPAGNDSLDDLNREKETSIWQWFHPVNWIAAFISFAGSFAVYVYTLQPTVGLEDQGELITAAYKLGVPHPPGYPMWTIVSKIFTFIPFGNIAYRVNLFSAVTGALAAAMITLILAKTADIFFGEQEKELAQHHLAPELEKIGLTTPRLVNSIIAITAGLLFAFTPGTWSQATIAEVYSLNAFYMVLLVLLSLIFLYHPHKRWLLCLITFVFAQGFTNHHTLVVMLASLFFLVIVTCRDEEHLFILIGNGLVFVVFMFYIWFGTDFRMRPFTDGEFFYSFILAFVAYLALAAVVNKALFNHTEWPKILASFYAGLLIYFYLPLSSITNPQLNWGRPRTVEGFWHSVLRGQYERLEFVRPTGLFLQQLRLYVTDTWDQYPLVVLLAVMSIFALLIFWPRERVRNWLVFCIITLISCGVGMVFLMNPKTDMTSLYINRVFFIMSHAALGLLIGYGMITISTALFSLSRRKDPIWKYMGLAIGIIMIAAYVGTGLYYAWDSIKELRMAGMSSFSLILRPAAAFAEVGDPVVFFYGSILLLIVGVLVIIGLTTPHKAYIISVCTALLFLITTLIPCLENWHETNLRKKYFGYVYGIELLRRCDENAIFFGGTDPGRFVPLYMINVDDFRSDIWLMTQNGLADATYMNVLRDRFSSRPAHVWPWVRTVLRWLRAEREDRGGDNSIYIPSPTDFERAFQLYVEDVQRRRARGEQIDEEVVMQDGRISVGGVAGVMRINGILSQMIWERNKDKHSFYVEESYVIPWMYDYMKPSGPIMKIYPERTTLTAEDVEKDFAYWGTLTNIFADGGVIDYEDKVTGRRGRILIEAGEFFHDEPAQKSFSKCRSAIAGLYENRQMWDEAEQAYRQALWLYPQSAEAHVRLANMYLRLQRFDDAYELISDYFRMDPLNERIGHMLASIRYHRDMARNISELHTRVFEGTDVTPDDYYTLARMYQETGNRPAALQIYDYMMSPMANITQHTSYAQLVAIFTEMQDLTRLNRVYDRMRELAPDDWHVLMDAALARAQAGRFGDFFSFITSAKEQDAERTRIRLRQDLRYRQAVARDPNARDQFDALMQEM